MQINMEKDKKKNILKFMVIGLMLIMALLIPEEVFAVNNTKNQNIVNELVDVEAVSYTHLTLPTITRV